MWKHPIDLFSMYFLFSKCRSFDNTQRTLSFEFSSYSCAYEKTKGQIPLRPNLHRENSKSTWRASQVVVVVVGGYSLQWPIRGGSTQKGYPLQASCKKCKRFQPPLMKLSWVRTPRPPRSWLCRGLNSPLMICSLSRGFLTRYRYRTRRVWFLVRLIIRFITSTLGTLRSEDGDRSESLA